MYYVLKYDFLKNFTANLDT